MTQEDKFNKWWDSRSEYFTENYVTKKIAFEIWESCNVSNTSEVDKIIQRTREKLNSGGAKFVPKYRKYG